MFSSKDKKRRKPQSSEHNEGRWSAKRNSGWGVGRAARDTPQAQDRILARDLKPFKWYL